MHIDSLNIHPGSYYSRIENGFDADFGSNGSYEIIGATAHNIIMNISRQEKYFEYDVQLSHLLHLIHTKSNEP